MLAAGALLRWAAQDDHEIGADLSLDQILAMVGAIAKIPGDPADLQPILHSALAGLRQLADR